ncbi:hypothetical protein B0H11DRAFT_2201640 [Mycena galericulata]|nr:hypothetical protein B0H11DRAFT_2201640 [Mycena galericulata]
MSSPHSSTIQVSTSSSRAQNAEKTAANLTAIPVAGTVDSPIYIQLDVQETLGASGEDNTRNAVMCVALTEFEDVAYLTNVIAQQLLLAEAMAGSSNLETFPQAPWVLQWLFGKGVKAYLRRRVSRCAQEEEAYMGVMVELDEQDDMFDDGEVEIDDDEVWGA